MKRGRKPSANPKIFKSVGMTAADWNWLENWHPADNPTSQLEELVLRAKKFWPAGPNSFR